MDILIFPIISDNDIKLPFYITSVGVIEQQEHVIRPSGHPEYHYLHCSSGEGKLILNKEEFILCPGTGFFIEPGLPHEYYSTKEPWKTYWITFEGFAVKDLCNAIFQNNWKVFNLFNHYVLEKHLDSICKSNAIQDSYSNHNSSVLLYEFLILLKANIDTAFQTKPLLKNQLQTVIGYIKNNYSSCITLDDLSLVASISPQHLCRIFKQAYNMRPFEYLTLYRVKRAKELLTNSQNYQIKTIASMVGYNDTSYFCSTFREYQGCSPLEFKKMFST